MEQTQLSNFCGLLNKDIYQDSSAFGIMVDFQYLLPKLKSEILSNKLELENNKNDYLDLVINEIENCDYDKKAGVKDIDKWLKKFNITLEDIFNRNIIGKEIYKHIESNFDYYPEMSEDRNIANSLQNDFLQFFCKYFADDIISFCNDNKSRETIKENQKSNDSYSETFLNDFCLKQSKYRLLATEESFYRLYQFNIIEPAGDLKKEINDNLLKLDAQKHLIYLNHVIETINKTEHVNVSHSIIDKWLIEFKVDISQFPEFDKTELHKLLSSNDYYATMPYPEFANIEYIQVDFYKYASMLECEKLLDYLDDLIINITQTNSTNKTDTKKIKWSGKASQFGFIMGTLADLSYIEAPKNHNGNINYKQFAKLLLEVYDVKTTQDSLEKYVNLESEKGQETVRKFKEYDFNIPHKNIVS